MLKLVMFYKKFQLQKDSWDTVSTERIIIH